MGTLLFVTFLGQSITDDKRSGVTQRTFLSRGRTDGRAAVKNYFTSYKKKTKKKKLEKKCVLNAHAGHDGVRTTYLPTHLQRARHVICTITIIVIMYRYASHDVRATMRPPHDRVLNFNAVINTR